MLFLRFEVSHVREYFDKEKLTSKDNVNTLDYLNESTFDLHNYLHQIQAPNPVKESFQMN